MKLSKKNSWAASVIKFTFDPYKEDLYNTNLCPFFWTSVAAVILVPFAAPYHFANLVIYDLSDYGLPPILGSLTMSLMIMFTMALVYLIGWMAWIMWPFILFPLALFLIMYNTSSLYAIKEVIYITGHKVNGSVKGVCPVIKWEE